MGTLGETGCEPPKGIPHLPLNKINMNKEEEYKEEWEKEISLWCFNQRQIKGNEMRELVEIVRQKLQEEYQKGFADGLCSEKIQRDEYTIEALQAQKQEIIEKINCEAACIKSGNKLTPQEQSIALEVIKNIKERLT